MGIFKIQLPCAVNTLQAAGDKYSPGHMAKQSEMFPGVLLKTVEQINSINANDKSQSCGLCTFYLTELVWWLLVIA